MKSPVISVVMELADLERLEILPKRDPQDDSDEVDLKTQGLLRSHLNGKNKVFLCQRPKLVF